MFALFLAASMAAPEPAREAQIINGMDLRAAKLSVDDIPIEFPEGTATMNLGVSAKGRLTSCRMAKWEAGGAPDPAKEEMICETLRRKGKFDPALDASGRPVDSVLAIGIDPQLESEPELTNIETLFTANDYPDGALRANGHGQVAVRLSVGPDGRASDCNVIKSSGNILLDSRTCEIFKRRGKFKVGRDGAGRLIPGTMINRVSWQLPDRRPLRESTLSTSITFDVHGDVVSCKSYWSDGEMQKEACRLLKTVAFKALTPVQRAFRTLSKEEGVIVGPAHAADLVGKHRGEQLMLLVAAIVVIDPKGAVTSCTKLGAADDDAVKAICEPLRKTQFTLDAAQAAQPGLSTVNYTALILRRPGF